MRNNYSQAEKTELVTQWKSSGISQKEWCKDQELSIHTFRKWVGRYGKALEEVEPKTEFIPLTFTDQVITSDYELQLIYPNGVKLCIPNTLPSKQIKDFIHLYDH